MTLQERAKGGPVLFDGAMGTMIHRKNPTDADYAGLSGCSEILCETRPDLIRSIHDEYLEAGSDVISTNSFGANEIVLAEYGIAGRARELARMSAAIARSAADAAFSQDKPRFVAGSIGPGTKLVSLGHTDWDTMYRSYREQAAGLLEGGVDAFLVETCQDLLQIKCAIAAIRDICAEAGTELPVLATMTVETTGTLLVGSEVGAVIAALEPFNLFALGINCATGPRDMAPYVREISRLWGGKTLVQPNAGLPRNVNGEFVYDLSIEEYVRSMLEFVERDGVSMVGGCCGTTPEFIGALSRALAEIRAGDPAAKGTVPPAGNPATESVSSLFAAQSLSQDPPPFFIGERTNTNGSKLFRETLLKDDWDALVEIARQQAETGVHALDLCVAYTGRNEKADMENAVSRIATAITVPLVIDSTDEAVLETALKRYGGRAIINSVNLEDGESRARRICSLAARYGAALIALVIDETGMAREAEQKLAIARRIHAIALDCGLRSGDLIFDTLTFTLGSGDETLRDSALQTMEAIRRVKAELPGTRTVLGLSNVSFGLSPASRKALNSVFLGECVKAGLDMAIVNLAQIVPLSALPEADAEASLRLIRNDSSAGDPLFAFLNHFTAANGTAGDTAAQESAESTKTGAELLSSRIVRGSKADLEDLLESELANRSALAIINEVLIPAMKTVGALFGAGKMQLPFVLQSAEVMKQAVALLESRLERTAERERTSIVLATVRGDVHDIGKNLVEIILSNNGYKVYNLGIKVEIAEIIRKAEEVGADAIGMSGLLVKSTAVMKENIEELARRNLKIPVLLGGAALTPSFVHEDCASAHVAPVAYCADAFAGLHAMNMIREGKLEEWLGAEREKLAALKRRATPTAALADSLPAGSETGQPPAAAYIEPRALPVPKPPFLGVRQQTEIDLDEVFAFLTEEVLFRGRWGYRRGKLTREEYGALIEREVKPEFERLKRKVREGELLRPAVSWGYFECNADGDSIIIWDPASSSRKEKARLSFPRQKSGERRCISDWFRPAEEGPDLIALQLCTVGARASAEAAKLYAENKYREYLLFHGLSVETAEALAEYWHRKIRIELGIAGEDGAGILDFVEQRYRGGRYSFGYPACPDLAGNRTLCELLDSASIGVSIGEGDQMFPEQTTSAFIAHHPQAKYFGA